MARADVAVLPKPVRRLQKEEKRLRKRRKTEEKTARKLLRAACKLSKIAARKQRKQARELKRKRKNGDALNAAVEDVTAPKPAPAPAPVRTPARTERPQSESVSGPPVKRQKFEAAASAPPPAPPSKEDARMVFLGKCPREIQTKDVYAHFASLGEDAILAVEWVMHKTQKRGSKFAGIGFVTFRTPELAKQACALPPFVFAGRTLLVEVQRQKKELRHLFLGHCPSRDCEPAIRSYFTGLLGDDSVASVQWHTKQDGSFAHAGHITFSDGETATLALQLGPPTIDGRPIVLEKCTGREGWLLTETQ
eukprot:NODE_1262_length_1003_cov_225.794549_g969_i0.p1 GENE.NODE_1262_length_1003_cov_225.794549_g969_i0~~NODE_1262_length_1003_cov_225.794549_g969_i0.p1  ORF type:complete len:307 (+),score=65.18 NODE_1262_length_1003_cov_225.794549_g969_i0:55-975(+)